MSNSISLIDERPSHRFKYPNRTLGFPSGDEESPRRKTRMNIWTNRERRWRKNGKRGVSPIIATILLVAITVVLAAVLYILISGLTKGPGNTPLGTALTLGTPLENGVAGKFWYNFTVQAA